MTYNSEQHRVNQMFDNMAHSSAGGRKLRWNPRTKNFEAVDSSAYSDSEKLEVTIDDMGHS
ncbi:MAG: hypothetical protein WD534_15160 [Phycisphaeraceae bacterium]